MHPEMKRPIFCLLLFFCLHSFAQDIPIAGQKRIFFPAPMEKGWQTSVGFIATTLPLEITEEAHFRVPAADLHLLRNLGGKFYTDIRFNVQGVQNLATIGPHWATPLSHRVFLGLGNDIGVWFGRINVAGIKTRGNGFQNYPNLSLGYRFNKRILLTVRGVDIMNFGVQTTAGNTAVESQYRFLSGSAYSVMLEQPFAGKKSMTLGFRAMYTDYFWQTWTLFENYDRNLFFPQFIVGLIL
jgi:hypothetical protein